MQATSTPPQPAAKSKAADYPVTSVREVRNTARQSRAMPYAGGELVWVADYRVRYADGYRPIIVTARDKEQAILFAANVRKWQVLQAARAAC